MKTAVIQFPGSNCDLDILHVLRDILQIETDLVWHSNFKSTEYDGAILPGGFSYGDYLRAGIIAAHSPAINQVEIMAQEGKPIIGICNGFQILIESELLPGALLSNQTGSFICKWINTRVETSNTHFTRNIPKGTLLKIPIAHAEGRYTINPKGLKDLRENDQIVLRYVDKHGNLTKIGNPNGSMDSIAGICNIDRNVFGLMPHPERASEKILSPFSTSDGLQILSRFIHT
ncbi:phosphoribosylformylglycinamidine synthase I [[Eubacterium] cellulosolvens]